MRTFKRNLAVTLIALCAAPSLLAHAASVTLNCTRGGVVALTVPVYSVFFDTGLAPANYLSVNTSLSEFDNLVYATFFDSTFDQCQLSADMRTYPSTVTLESIAASVSPKGAYTQLVFSYEGLTAHTGALLKPSSKKALTPEEKSKALAAFLARVPPTN